MKKMSYALIGLLCVISAGCSSDSSKKPVKTAEVNTESIIDDKSVSPKQKAERLALASEQLVSPLSFMYANDVASQALQLDAKNQKAQFVKALVAPMMALKGVMARIQPIATRTPEGKANYDRAIQKLQDAPKHALRDFLLEGPADIKNETDAQNLIDSVRSAFTKQRQFFKSAKNSEMTLNLPEMFVIDELDREDKCYWTANPNGTYEQYCIEAAPPVLQYKLNRADFEALQQIVAGTEIYFVLMNSYSLAGALDVNDKFKDSNGVSKEVREALLANKEFATLRGKSLASILEMGLDAVAGVRYARNIQDQLCKSGNSRDQNRPGFLFRSICIEENTSRTPLDQILASIELVFKGGLYDTAFATPKGGVYETQVRAASFFEGGVRDVRDLGLTFDECNRVVSASDSTLGGVFVKKDANAVLSLNRSKCN